MVVVRVTREVNFLVRVKTIVFGFLYVSLDNMRIQRENDELDKIFAGLALVRHAGRGKERGETGITLWGQCGVEKRESELA